jgi:DnaJ-class molecular chaperone
MSFTKSPALKVLGLTGNPSADEIKTAYRKMAMKHHPDREGGNESKFKAVQSAYDWLNGNVTKATAKPDSPRGPFRDFNKEDFEFDQSYFDEILRSADRAKAGAKEGAQSWSKSEFEELKDEQYTSVVRCSLADAYNGTELMVEFPKLGKKPYKIDIPPRSIDGVKVRTIVENDYVFNRRIILHVHMKINLPQDCTVIWATHPNLYGGGVEGSGNIEIPFDVDWKTAMMGSFATVTTVDGAEIEFRVPAGIQPNTRLRIKDKGYWKDSASKTRGDLLLRIQFKTPALNKLSDEELKEAIGMFEKELANR